MKIQEISIDDEDYPTRLRNIKNPPKKIYVIGNKEILNNKGIAIIGSRDCTDEGSKNARIFSANIAKEGFTIISGMAKGIDAAAHLRMFRSESEKQLLYFGCGPDYIFPKENKEIYNSIIENGGAIISEYPKGTEAESERFRKRNRIVSALSLGVLVVEAEIVSGTSITARYAKEQGKKVFCIPSSIENKKGVGTNNLIKKGAKLVTNPKEILEEYGECKEKQITIEELEKKNKTKVLDINGINEEYREIYKVLYEPLSINEISLKTGIDITEVYSKLFMMQLEEIIIKNGNKYTIA